MATGRVTAGPKSAPVLPPPAPAHTRVTQATAMGTTRAGAPSTFDRDKSEALGTTSAHSDKFVDAVLLRLDHGEYSSSYDSPSMADSIHVRSSCRAANNDGVRRTFLAFPQSVVVRIKRNEPGLFSSIHIYSSCLLCL